MQSSVRAYLGCMVIVTGLSLHAAHPIPAAAPARAVPTLPAVPAPEAVFGTPISPEANAYLTACAQEYNALQNRLHTELLATAEHYDVDFVRGRITFKHKDGSQKLLTFEAVGSMRTSDKIWQWAWSNPAVSPGIAVPQTAMRGIGVQYALKYITEPRVPVPDEEFPYYLSSIALKVRGGLGVYEIPSGDLRIYVLLRDPHAQVGNAAAVR